MPHVRRAASFALALTITCAACASDPPDAQPSAGVETTGADTSPPATTSAPVASEPVASEPVASRPIATDEPTTTVAGPPPGIISASPFQYRLDWAAGVFQVRIRNQSTQAFTLVGVQFVWDGFTTPVAERHDSMVPGLTLDFPVQVAAADCAGDGLVDDMPPVADAVVRLALDDGSTIDAPVFDVDGVARRLYLDDCERQMIESLVAIEWTDLHDEPLDGRIVTGGGLRMVRTGATGEVRLLSVSNTVLFTVETLETAPDEPVATLEADHDEVVAPIRITENRCDAHARSESSQSFRFVGQIDLGGGDVHPYTILPSKDDQVQMRARLEAGCASLEQTGFVGQDG